MGGKSSGSQTQKTEPWSGQQPYLKYGFQQAQDIYNSGGPGYYPNATYVPFSQQSETALGMMEGRALAGSPLNQMAQQYGADTLSGAYLNSPYGKATAGGRASNITARSGINEIGNNALEQTAQGDFLNANPYVDDMYDMSAQAVGRNYRDAVVPTLNATFASGGRTGSRAQTDAFANSQRELGETLNNLSTQTYYNNYLNERQNQLGAANSLSNYSQQDADRYLRADMSNQGSQNAAAQRAMQASMQNSSLYGAERARQQQMASLAPELANLDYADMERLFGVGQAVEGKAGQVLQDDINRFDHYQNLPEQNLQNYIQAIQGNYGGTTTASNNPSTMQKVGDGVQMIASIASLFSDLRLKDKVNTIGRMGPLRIVEWEWNDEGRRMAGDDETLGFVAQEVAEVYPDLVMERDGYLAINKGEVIRRAANV